MRGADAGRDARASKSNSAEHFPNFVDESFGHRMVDFFAGNLGEFFE